MGYQTNGEYSYRLETTGMPPGVYILGLKAENEFVASRIIKIR
jgi:hypothetical protein